METGPAPSREGTTAQETQRTKTCMYCGESRPASDFRRRTGKRRVPGPDAGPAVAVDSTVYGNAMQKIVKRDRPSMLPSLSVVRQKRLRLCVLLKGASGARVQ